MVYVIIDVVLPFSIDTTTDDDAAAGVNSIINTACAMALSIGSMQKYSRSDDITCIETSFTCCIRTLIACSGILQKGTKSSVIIIYGRATDSGSISLYAKIPTTIASGRIYLLIFALIDIYAYIYLLLTA